MRTCLLPFAIDTLYECSQESLTGSEVFAFVTVTTLVDCSDNVGGDNDERLTDAGTNEVVPASVRLLSVLPPGIILSLTVSLHWFAG